MYVLIDFLLSEYLAFKLRNASLKLKKILHEVACTIPNCKIINVNIDGI